MRVKSEANDRSGIVTENMTSWTADHVTGTSWKNVQVDENWEFVVWPSGWASATNLTYTAAPTNGVVNSDTWTDATIPLADATNAWLFSPAEKTKVWFITITQPVDLDAMELDVTDLTTLSWVASNTTNLWTFTWTTIPDNQTNKQALQSLETAVEARQLKIQFQDEWVNFWAPWQITTINFTGAWVTSTMAGSTMTIDIPTSWWGGWVAVYHSFDYPWWPFTVPSPNHWDLFFYWFWWWPWDYWNSSFANRLPIE